MKFLNMTANAASTVCDAAGNAASTVYGAAGNAASTVYGAAGATAKWAYKNAPAFIEGVATAVVLAAIYQDMKRKPVVRTDYSRW